MSSGMVTAALEIQTQSRVFFFNTTYQESTTRATTKKSAAAYLRMRARMQLHLKKKKYE